MNSIQNGLSSLLQTYRQIQARTAESMKMLGSGKRVTHPKVNPAAWREISSHTGQAEKIQGFSENLTNAGVSVRIALAAIDATDKHNELLRGKLAAAAAASEGSDARRDNLEEFNRVFSAMADLATPADPGARRLLGDPSSVPNAGDITIRAGVDFTFTLRHRPIHLGEGGLEIDPFADPASASLAEIQASMLQIETASDKLAASRQSLTSDATAITNSDRYNIAMTAQNMNHAERVDTPDLNREAIMMQSLSARTSIAVHGLTSLQETRLMALQLLP